MENQAKDRILSSFLQASDINMDEKITKKDWIEFGEKNIFPKELIEINLKSAKNYSILKNLSNMIVGNGFNVNSPQAIKFIENEYCKTTLNDILEMISLDFVLTGAFSLNIVWSRDGKSISKIKYIPVEKVRIAKQDEDDLDIDESVEDYFLCDDWGNIRKNKPKFIKGFDPKDTSERSQLIYVKRNTPGMEFYSLPHYIGALNWVRLDYHVSEYHLNNALNGYHPSMLINLSTGIPSVEEQRRVKIKMDEMFKGTASAGKMMLTFSEGKDTAPTIEPLNLSDSDKKYVDIDKLIMDNLLIANNITNPMLVGIMVPGQLGGGQELVDSFNLLQITIINSYQKIIEETFNELSSYNNVSEEIKISELNYSKKEEKLIEEVDVVASIENEKNK